jgi:glyoxylase-like metal-dependent hydrolase (beta-lactamase superfamily II)
MTYSGHVSVGGPAAVRELVGLIITKVAVGPMDNNSYLLRCRTTGSQVLIDAAAEPDTLLGVIGDSGLDAIITTHQHRDHWGALAEVVKATGARTFSHADDAEGILPHPTELVANGEQIAVGNQALTVTHLVGHTPGSIALLYDDPEGQPHTFTGDSLFPGGVGKTWSPEDFTSLLDDVEQRIFEPLPDETWVYPGHGDDTTLGRERPHLAEWRERGW